MTPRRLRLTTAVLLLLGAVLRAVFVWKHPRFDGDTLIYGDLARNMLVHHVYGVTEAKGIRPTLIRLPGYPAFLAACFTVFGPGRYLAVLWVQALADLLNCWLLGRLAARVFGERVGLLALALAAFCPFTANYCAVGLAETLSLLCVTAALFAMDVWLAQARQGRPWNAWLVALWAALTYAVLLRPDQSLLPLAVLPVMLFASWRAALALRNKLRLGPTAAVCAGLLLPLLLWGVRNQRALHHFQPLAPKYANDPTDSVSYGFYRWYRTWAVEYKSNLDVYWAYDGDPLSMSSLPPRAFDNQQQKLETAKLLERYNQESASTPAVDAQFYQLAGQRIRANPVRYYVWLPVARLADMWLRPRTEFMSLPLDWWAWRSHPRGSALALACGLINVALLVTAGFGFVRWKRAVWANHGALAAAALLFVVLRCGLLLTLDNSEPRYTIECYPVVLLLASFAFSSHPAGAQRGDRRPLTSA